MKQFNIRILLMASLLISGSIMTACGDASSNTPVETAGKADTTPVTEVVTEDPRIPSILPADLDLGGETINVWYFTKNSDAAERFLDLNGDPEGDIVEAAMYDRNVAVEEQLNMKFNYVDPGVASGDVGTEIRKVLMAGDTTYDLYNVIQWNSSKLALEHCFLNLADQKLLALDQPWWSQAYIENMSIGSNSNIYFVTGDVSLDMIRCIGSMYFNKNQFANLYDNAEILYQEVLDGKWTFEKMLEYAEEGYRDVNGNSQIDEGDQYGLITNHFNNIDCFGFGMGSVFSRRDKDNLPYLTVSEEHNVDIYNKIYHMIAEAPGVLMYKTEPNPTLHNVETFSEGNALFLPGFLYTSENLRDMKEDYGIIPFPKYDESQEEYLSSVHDIATLMCLPTTCTKIDAVCATLEAMAYYSYYEVTPIYYETALKTKYTRDDLSSQIIDIIHDSAMTDLAYVYQQSLSEAGMVMRLLAANKTKDYVSFVAKKEKAYTKALDKFITNFEEADN